MARVNVTADLELDAPTLIEGLPGVGLVGKIVADFLVDRFEMVHYANVHCEGVPPVTTYAPGDPALRSPVRLYGDEERDLLVLASDVPVSPAAAVEFARCIEGWFDEEGATPLYLSGLPTEAEEQEDDRPALYGVATGEGEAILERATVAPPPEGGVVSGPTGALLAHALETSRTSVGLIAQADPQFPDPTAARTVIEDGVAPITGLEVDVSPLEDSAEEIRQAKKQLAAQVGEDDENSSQARPLRMYQ